MTEGDRQPVSFCSALSFCFTCVTMEIGISAFSLLAGSFLFESGQYRIDDRCVRFVVFFVYRSATGF